MKRSLVVMFIVCAMLLVGANVFAANMSASIGYTAVDKGNSDNDLEINNSMFVEASIAQYLATNAKAYGKLKYNLDEYGMGVQSREAVAGVTLRVLCETCTIDINYNIERLPTGENLNTVNGKGTIGF